MNETTLQRIERKTKRKVIECKCEKCKMQCKVSPCIGTPEDIEKIIAAGFVHRLAPTDWMVGKIYGIIDHSVDIVAPIYDKSKGACTFFTDGLCELHDLGLKPTEGKLSIHTGAIFNSVKEFKQKSIAWQVIQEWL